jgi:serine/threonine protein kinase/tetratricopeptide (TPR) repeat protein
MTPCPTSQQLEQLVGDRLDAAQQETIAAHLQHCTACQQFLDRLTHDTSEHRRAAADRSQADPETELLQILRVQGPLIPDDARAVDLRAARDDPARRARAERGASTSDRSTSPSGSHPVIAGFRILREIGRGGMGIVYEAEQEVLSRRVALKVLPARALIDPTRIQRFEREAKAAARLHHTNIVPVFGVGEQDGLHYYVMQYIEGSGLDYVLHELRWRYGADPAPAGEPRIVPAPAPGQDSDATMVRSPAEFATPGPSDDLPSWSFPGSAGSSALSGFDRPFFDGVARVGLMVAEALEYAHRQGILHRDIKPSNLLLDVRGNVWITDFGLAKTPGADDLTESGDVVGTIGYMAPERFRGLCDGRSDLYSLGLTLYELASLRRAYDERDRYRLIDRVRREEPPRLRTRAPRVPRDLETIIQTAIAREPSRRYPRAGDMAADLRRFLEGRPIQARRASHPERFARWCRRNPWVAGLSAAVLASLILGTVVSTVQAFRARRAEAETRLQRDRAETQARIATAVQDFLRKDMLAQASAFNHSTLHTKPDADLKVRTALDRAAATIGERFADQPEVEASIRQTVGETYRELGLYREAEAHLQRALHLRRSVLGSDDPETLLAMKSLGDVYLADDRLAEAQPLLVGALQGLQKARDARPSDRLDAMASMAQLDYQQGNLTEAERLLGRVRDAYLSARGEDDEKTLDVTANLGMVYLQQGHRERAERVLSDVVDRSERSLGLDHPFTSVAKQCLGDIERDLGKIGQATQLAVETTASLTKVLGRGHPETLASMARLGNLYVHQDLLDKAEALLTEALAGCRTALDRNHDTTDTALVGLANVYAKRQDMKQLTRVLIEAADITRIRWGKDSEAARSANLSAGSVLLIGQRDYARAEPYLRDCLTAWVRSGPGDGRRSFAELVLGVCLLGQKKYTEAKSHFLSGYNGMRPGRDHLPPAEHVDLGWLLEHVERLRDESGRLFVESTTLSILRRDPALQNIVLDLQFPG